ncbi:MAG: DUF2235 domain-containing protein, partial [Actinomycetota bacterium]|nr:DUF2235 domain-containing protein [Actinomycetota bacterium]
GTSRSQRLTGGAFGLGLSRNVRDCYRFVIECYEPGDELFFFGFSRGAFTARSTVGLIRNAGVLRREHADRLDDAYRLYRSGGDARAPTGLEAELFRRSFAHPEVRIHFVGVWDTVGALGIPGLPARIARGRWGFHDTKLSSYVDFAYQALAIDEQRRPFLPTLWQRQEHATEQVLQQVWFAGAHSDVGGGYPDPSLSEIALLWIVERAHSCGLQFTAEAFTRVAQAVGEPRRRGRQVSPSALGPITDSRRGLYRLLKAYHRPLLDPTGVACSAVSSTAVRRADDDRAHYNPANLASYRAAGGPITTIDIG